MRIEQRGFTLIETIISIGLLTGALVVLAHLAAISVEANATARHRTLATLLAEQKLEQMRAEPVLNDVADAFEHLRAGGEPACEGQVTCAESVYVRRWSIGPVGPSPQAALLRVAVRHIRYGEVRLVTVRARRVR